MTHSGNLPLHYEVAGVKRSQIETAATSAADEEAEEAEDAVGVVDVEAPQHACF